MEMIERVAESQPQVSAFPVSLKDLEGSSTADGNLARRRLHEIPITGVEIPVDDPNAITDKPPKKNKKAKNKLKGKSKKTLGTARGIETMFRSSYRTQLDLTALAATKANIMISLNGFILSVLTLSGPFVLVAEPLFTVPIAVFLATCLISIIFAVLAAQPRRLKSRPTVDDFKKDRANLLVFEEFSVLTEQEHLKAMMGLMHNNTRIYKNMTRQIYMLGNMANSKFRMLSVSYTAFLVGLTVSTVMLLAIGFFHHTPDLASIFNQIKLRPMG